MTSQWRFNHARLKDFTVSRIGSVWPDVEKTVIYPKLLAFGINAKELYVLSDSGFFEAVMGSDPAARFNRPNLYVNPDTVLKAYPDSESTYIGLVHELAHLLQALTGEISYAPLQKGSIREWLSMHHEKDALRWSGRQAKLMGWSQKRLEKQMRSRYGHHDADVVRSIHGESVIGYKLHPKQETIPFLQRHPQVAVRRYRRRR